MYCLLFGTKLRKYGSILKQTIDLNRKYDQYLKGEISVNCDYFTL